MATRRPPRLHSAVYIGFNAYLVTVCSFQRRVCLATPLLFSLVQRHILESSARHGVEAIAYCVMPDHLHMLLLGTRADADLCSFVKDIKQRTAFEYSRDAGGSIWQDGFHDHVLRRDEEIAVVACHLLMNPVRARLVEDPLAWPFMGSQRYDLRDLFSSVGTRV